MKPDLILIPKQIRAWFDAMMAVVVFAATVVLPALIMVQVSLDKDLLTVISVGSFVTLLFILYVRRGLRKGYIVKEMFTAPLDQVKDKSMEMGDSIKKLVGYIVKEWLVILIIGLMLINGVARAELNEYEVKKIAYFRDLIMTIKNYTTPVVHLGVYRGYVFKDAKGVYLMINGKNVTVEEFEVWLNNYNENDQNQQKELCDITREFTYWPMYDENIKKTKEEVSEGLAKLLKETTVSK